MGIGLTNGTTDSTSRIASFIARSTSGPTSRIARVSSSSIQVPRLSTDAIATPHQLGRFEGHNVPGEVRRRVVELQAALEERRIPLRVSANAPCD